MESYQVKNHEPVEKQLKEMDQSNPITPYLCMALYQKCTMLYLNKIQFNTKIGDLFLPLFELAKDKSNRFKLLDPSIDAPLIRPLLDNDFKNNLRVSDETWQFVDLSLLLVQIKFSVIYTRYQMIEPLRSLILDPISMIEKYFKILISLFYDRNRCLPPNIGIYPQCLKTIYTTSRRL